mmetsp:Transcript_12389/g.38265  ORF Transcript_12389/g.38265 Transcript_12389/m.38265 type:complete len:378 (+) Transcript_12389:31-1164(+)
MATSPSSAVAALPLNMVPTVWHGALAGGQPRRDSGRCARSRARLLRASPAVALIVGGSLVFAAGFDAFASPPVPRQASLQVLAGRLPSHGGLAAGRGCSSTELRSGQRHRRRRGAALRALDAEGLANFASFSALGGAPIPLMLSALLRRSEDMGGTASAPAAGGARPAETAEPRGLMWAFPSFAVFLESATNTAPQGFPSWARWLCLATFWPGLVWYLYYKTAVEEDLRQYRGLGIGGYVVIVPFALGLAAGIWGELAYGSLEGGPLDDVFSIAFYAAFAWIYLNQWFLYNKVNQLFTEEGLPAPLDPWGLLVPGWNFVTGIRQIHFLAEYWSRQRGEEPTRDAFAELFPFVKKPTLTLWELVSTPALWIDMKRLVG